MIFLLWLLGAVGRATALAFARVFAVATVVSRPAAALTLTGVLALASMLFFDLLVILLVPVLPLILGAEGSLQRRKQSRSVNCSDFLELAHGTLSRLLSLS